jgi:hypothetical protein
LGPLVRDGEANTLRALFLSKQRNAPTRVIEGLLPVMRELGLVTIFWEVNFGNVQMLFDEQGTLLDQSYLRRLDKFLNELIWMARVLRYGRENIPEVNAE